jgi:surfactin synthase thioesterase subunit
MRGRNSYAPRGVEKLTGTRLFCFHHAGGAASTFSGWEGRLSPDVSVVPVQLPGRERRACERRFTTMTELVDDLDSKLDHLLTGRFAFYGHSMGAIVAYNLTAARAARGASLPSRLMVGAYPPPHTDAPITAALELSDAELAEWLIGIGGMSEMLLRYPEWVDSAIAMVRDDLRVCQSHDTTAVTPLPVPIEVFAGERDPLLPLARVASWDQHSTAGCQVHPVPGGHFFIHESAGHVLRIVDSLLTGALSRA